MPIRWYGPGVHAALPTALSVSTLGGVAHPDACHRVEPAVATALVSWLRARFGGARSNEMAS